MKNYSIFRLQAIFCIAIALLFSSNELNAQTDILDLWFNPDPVNPIYNCSTSPDVRINFNYDLICYDSTVIISNKSGFRYFNDGDIDQKYQFCGPNNTFCGTPPNAGEFWILFEFNGSGIGIKKINFVITKNHTINCSVIGYNGITSRSFIETNLSPTVSRYTYDNGSIAIDKVVITCIGADDLVDISQLFFMDDLHLPTTVPATLPAAVANNSGPVCAGGALNLTGAPAGMATYSWTGPDSFTSTLQSPPVSANATTAMGGTYTLTVTDANGCTNQASTIATINPLPAPITGTTTTCIGLTTTLSDITSGGTWSSDSPAVATVNSSGVVTGVSVGTALISYTLPTGCYVRPNVTVNQSPSISTVAPPICVGSTTTLAGSPSGGTWSSSVPAVATISPSGVVTAVSAGTTIITYALPTLCSATASLNVSPLPAPIAGITNVDIGSTTTLSSATSGGVWSSASPGVATINSVGVVTGISTGNSVISYTLPSGCYVTVIVTVADIPDWTSEVVCILDLSYSMNRDFYDISTTDDDAVKLKHAKNGLIAFIDLLYMYNPNVVGLGLARFPNSPQVGCDAAAIYSVTTLDATHYSNVTTSIPTLVADGGSTPLLTGIDKGIEMLFPATKKVLVLLSDGRQNCPNTGIPSLVTNAKSAMSAAGVKLFTIGFGSNAIVPNDMLNDLASASGGSHYDVSAVSDKSAAYDPSAPSLWAPATALNSSFAHIIVDGLGLNYINDPLEIINSGTIEEFSIPVTELEERVSFFVSWVTSAKNYLNVRLVTPGGALLPPTQRGVLSIHRSNHTIITLTKSLLRLPGMTGNWKLIIDGSNVHNESEHYQYSVLTLSKKLDFRTWFEKRRYYTGDEIKIYLKASIEGKPITGIEKITVKATRPAKSPGNWLVSELIDHNMLENARQRHVESYINWISNQPQFKRLEKEEIEKSLTLQKAQFISKIDPVDLRASILLEDLKVPLTGRELIKGLTFRDDGRKGDQQSGDGIYTATFIPKTAGSHSFNISGSNSQKGEEVKRESHLQTYVRPKIDLRPDFRKIKLVENALKGEIMYDIIFSLKDKYGNLPTPDDLINLTISVDKGIVTGGITDNMDATFTQRITLPEDIKSENVIMTLSLDGRSESVKIRKGATYQVIIAVVLIIIVALGLILRRKRK